jgi:hypothetical protein
VQPINALVELWQVQLFEFSHIVPTAAVLCDKRLHTTKIFEAVAQRSFSMLSVL